MEPVLDTTPPAPGLHRYGWASARLDLEPELLMVWAATEDRDLRRAVMRSPELERAAAELVVATRRSGMHTLGMNPAAPVDLLRSNPGARRRRARLLELVPGGLDEVRATPGTPHQIAAGSPTVDLVLARHRSLPSGAAEALLGRSDPPVDPWVAAQLVARVRGGAGGAPRWWSAQRRRVVELLGGAARDRLDAFVSDVDGRSDS